MKKRIVIHCSATPPSMDIGAEEIRRWHIEERGWKDIGYAGVFRRSGILELGRDLDDDGDVIEEIGAHAMGFNKDSIGICLVGGVDKKGRPENNFTEEQFSNLAWYLGELTSRYPSITEICGHRDLPGVKKACPSFDVKAWLKTLPEGHLSNVEI